jgi:hypothetical protein
MASFDVRNNARQSPARHVIGTCSEPSFLELNDVLLTWRALSARALLLGHDEYTRVLDAKYKQLASQWLTPVEIFKPHYARAIATYMLREMDPGYPLRQGLANTARHVILVGCHWSQETRVLMR